MRTNQSRMSKNSKTVVWDSPPRRRDTPASFFQSSAKKIIHKRIARKRRTKKINTLSNVGSTKSKKRGLLDLFGGKSTLKVLLKALMGGKEGQNNNKLTSILSKSRIKSPI